MSAHEKVFHATKVLGPAARATLEGFVIDKLGADAEEHFEMGPGTITIDHVKRGEIRWGSETDENGDEVDQCYLVIRFVVPGTWSPT